MCNYCPCQSSNSDYAVPAGQASLHPNWALSRFLQKQKYVPIGFADRPTSHSRGRWLQCLGHKTEDAREELNQKDNSDEKCEFIRSIHHRTNAECGNFLQKHVWRLRHLLQWKSSGACLL